MIVHKFDLVRVAILETEAEAPLVVDSDAHLPGSVAFQCFQPIARRNVQKPEISRGVQLLKLHPRPAGEVRGDALDRDTLEERLGPSVGEAPDHDSNVLRN